MQHPKIAPNTSTAAMVWPADNATANLFLKTHGTCDPNGSLSGLGYDAAVGQA
jgi:hypothetical protein